MINILSKSQIVILDLIRGISAITVLIGHILSRTYLDTTFGKYYPWQSLSVVVFFWLSGFLITYHCIVKKDYSFTEYIVDRFSRIYILYIFAFFMSVLFSFYLNNNVIDAKVIVSHILMLQHTPFSRIDNNLITFATIPINTVLWTIAIEWWLYILFGIIFFIAKSSKSERFFMSVMLVPALMVVGYFTLKEYVAWVWVFGSIAAIVFIRTPEPSKYSVIFVLVVSMLAFALRLHVIAAPPPASVNMYDLQLSACLTIALFCIVRLAAHVEFPNLIMQISAKAAFISYTLYLIHEPIREALMRRWQWVAPDGENYISVSRAFLTFVVCLCAATIVAFALENKHLKLRSWLKHRKCGLGTPGHGSV